MGKRTSICLLTFLAVALASQALPVQSAGPLPDAQAIRDFLELDACKTDRDAKTDFLAHAPWSAPWGEVQPQTAYIETFKGKFDCGYTGLQYTALIRAFEWHLTARAPYHTDTLLLWFHGGLVPGTHGFDGASQALSILFSDPQRLDAFPVFVVWHTGFGEAAGGSWFSPSERQSTAHGLLNRTYEHRRADAERRQDETTHNDLGDPSAAIDAREDEFRLYNVGSGALIWHFMIDEAEDTFRGPFTGSNIDNAGALLIRDIARLHREHPQLRVVLVGHSAGAIAVSSLIENYNSYVASAQGLENPKSPMKFGVIFLAPAVSYMRFERALRTNRIANFRMFTMTDLCERRDHVSELSSPSPSASPSEIEKAKFTHGLYPYSLLYFISGVLHTYPDYPLLGMARYLNRSPSSPYAQNLLLRGVQNRLLWYAHPIVLSPSDDDKPGLASHSLRHGNFSTDPSTLQSIAHFVDKEQQEPVSAGQSTLPPVPTPQKSPCYDTSSTTDL